VPAATAVLALAAWVAAADRPKPFVPANYPLNTAPVNWPTNPGTRYKMPEMVNRCGAENMAIKVSVSGWTEPLYRKDEMGVYRVGDRKDGRDGGTFRCTLYWMDEKGEKVLRTDGESVRPACATCGGFHVMYFNIPSFARTGRHRLRLTYVHSKLNLNLKKDLWFHVVNDGSWDDSTVLAEAAEKYPVVTVLQSGRGCGALGIDSYKGVSDTYGSRPQRRLCQLRAACDAPGGPLRPGAAGAAAVRPVVGSARGESGRRLASVVPGGLAGRGAGTDSSPTRS